MIFAKHPFTSLAQRGSSHSTCTISNLCWLDQCQQQDAIAQSLQRLALVLIERAAAQPIHQSDQFGRGGKRDLSLG